MENKYDIGRFVNVLTWLQVRCDVANRVRKRRKELKISQQELAKKSGVSYASIRRFETTGEISFVSLLRIADALGYLKDFTLLFKETAITNLEDLKWLKKI